MSFRVDAELYRNRSVHKSTCGLRDGKGNTPETFMCEDYEGQYD